MTEKRYYCNKNFAVIDSKTKKSCSYFKCMNLLNEREEEIKELEMRIERNRKNNMALLSFIDDVLNCARYSGFYDNKELVKIISGIAEKLKRNLY